MHRLLLLLTVAVFGVAFSAWAAEQAADDFRAVVLYDVGGKFDSSFNEAAYNGAERFKLEFGVGYRDFEPTSETQYEQALKRFARRKYDLVIGIGLGYAVAISKVAPLYPDRRFATIDALVDLPNVSTITFKENEGSFLVGVAAALASTSAQVGFVGGMDIPLIRRFELGFRQGVAHINPAASLVSNYVGSTAAAWNNPIKASELARTQFARGVDVIFHAAGPSGLGVIQAAKDTGHLAIGVDSNQNGIAPGSVLTSMLKRVDTGVYTMMRDAYKGEWQAGHKVLGLSEGGVDYAYDDNNRTLLTDAIRRAMDAARADIVSGAITVDDVTNGNSGK